MTWLCFCGGTLSPILLSINQQYLFLITEIESNLLKDIFVDKRFKNMKTSNYCTISVFVLLVALTMLASARPRFGRGELRKRRNTLEVSFSPSPQLKQFANKNLSQAKVHEICSITTWRKFEEKGHYIKVHHFVSLSMFR